MYAVTCVCVYSLNTMFYTHVEQSPTNAIYLKVLFEEAEIKCNEFSPFTHTFVHTHTHTHTLPWKYFEFEKGEGL